MNVLPLILLTVLINTAAQLLFKHGMTRIGYFDFSLSNVVPISLQIASNPFIVSGIFCYVLSVAVWLLVLSRVEVGFAYPMSSLGYVATALAAYCILHEPLSLVRIAGIFVIIFGVYLIARS